MVILDWDVSISVLADSNRVMRSVFVLKYECSQHLTHVSSAANWWPAYISRHAQRGGNYPPELLVNAITSVINPQLYLAGLQACYTMHNQLPAAPWHQCGQKLPLLSTGRHHIIVTAEGPFLCMTFWSRPEPIRQPTLRWLSLGLNSLPVHAAHY